MAMKLKRGEDWHGWAWHYDDDPDYGTGFRDELFDERVRWAHGYKTRGHWERVKLVRVTPPRKRKG